MLKKIKENMYCIQDMKNETKEEWKLNENNQLNIVSWKFWDKIKANLEDIVDYKKDLRELWKLKEKRSKELIEKYNYNEDTKFYRWVSHDLIRSESWKYYISSHDNSKTMIVHLDWSHGFTNNEVISVTDRINYGFAPYWPLLARFTLKDVLEVWWILSDSDLSIRLFQFQNRTEVPVSIAKNTAWTIDIYPKYKELLSKLYPQEIETWYEHDSDLRKFYILDNKWNKLVDVDYKIDDITNTIIIVSENNNIDYEHLRLVILGIVIKWSSLRKDNISVRVNGKDTPFENFL